MITETNVMHNNLLILGNFGLKRTTLPMLNLSNNGFETAKHNNIEIMSFINYFLHLFAIIQGAIAKNNHTRSSCINQDIHGCHLSKATGQCSHFKD